MLFQEIMEVLFFVYGYGGTEKIFVHRTISATLKSKGQIVLTIAVSEIASFLLSSGRTVDSKFEIPLNINKDSACNNK